MHGIDEENEENTDEVFINVLKKEMDKEILNLDIDRSHRVGNQKLDKSKPRRIIIKFSRARIFKNKRKLNGKQTSVTESWTKTRMKKLQKAREEHGFRNVWSNDGDILYIDANDHNRVSAFYD